MNATRFLTNLFAIAEQTDFAEWVAFRHAHPDVLCAFRFEDNNQGYTFPGVVVTYAPNRITVYKYYGAPAPSIYTCAESWAALQKIREYLDL